MTAMDESRFPRRAGWLAALLLVAACGSATASTDADTAESAVIGQLPAVASTLAPEVPASTTSTTEPPPPGFSAAFSGDILIHSQVWTQAQQNAGGAGYDFAPMWDDVRALISSVDLAVCHLEVPIAPEGKEPSTFPLYGAPKELVAGIKSAGWDRCSTASNHTLDQGVPGIEATLAAFDEQGLTQAGMARTPDEIEPKVIDVRGVKVTHLSYTWGYNGLSTPTGEDWRSALNSSRRIIADATAARALGAQVVIVSMHWGTEPAREVTRYQRDLANAITASGQVNLIVGCHSHVIQQIEQINGVWVVFGMGNHLSAHPTRDFFPPSTQDGEIVTVDFAVGDDGSITVAAPVVHPTWVDRDHGYVIRDVLAQLARPDLTAGERAAYEVSLQRTSDVVGPFIAVP